MKEGEILRLVRVRFPGQTQSGVFLANNFSSGYGERVVAMSNRGMTVGYVNSQIYEAKYSKEMGDILHIKGMATDEEVAKYKESYQKQRNAGSVFKRLVQEFDLPMELVDVAFVSQGKKSLFYYTAPTRVDFRELLKVLSAELKVRIELKQVLDANVRSTGVGPCGPDLCLFINSTTENSGTSRRCSESFCCLEDNDSFYEDKRSRLPKNYTYISTHTGEVGKVTLLDFVKEEFEMLTDQGCVKRYVAELYKENLKRKPATFPRSFENISYGNKIVNGIDKRLEQEKRNIEIENERSDKLAKEFADKVWHNMNVRAQL